MFPSATGVIAAYVFSHLLTDRHNLGLIAEKIEDLRAGGTI